jgi:hypothetical protein
MRSKKKIREYYDKKIEKQVFSDLLESSDSDYIFRKIISIVEVSLPIGVETHWIGSKGLFKRPLGILYIFFIILGAGVIELLAGDYLVACILMLLASVGVALVRWFFLRKDIDEDELFRKYTNDSFDE